MHVVKAVDETEHMFVIRFLAIARAVLRVYLQEHVSPVTTATGILGARHLLLTIRSPVAKGSPFVNGFGVLTLALN
jgi:hypothetical protein